MANMDGRAVFASYNIHKCVGSDRRFDPGRVAKVIAEIGGDVIALQEADRRFGDRAGLLDLPALEREAGLIPVPVRPAKVRHRGHGWHGNVVLVREGLVRDLRQISLPGLEPRGALVVDLDLAPGPVRVVAAHLGLFRQSRLLQVEALLDHVGETTDRPVVLMGDLNEWRFQRRSALRGFGHGFGPVMPGVPTFPAYFPMLALDRVMANPKGIIESISAHDTPLARVASDHLPLRALVRLDGEVEARDALPHIHHPRPRRRPLLDRLLPESRV
jgi:endonuclease/exonuclease/phosphatase family metal-dependent hydrolase